MTKPFSGQFQLSITRALHDQLAEALSELTPAALTQENLSTLNASPGVYQLYHNGQFVYVGKADESLRSRLSDHYEKISGRNLPLEEMTFTCLYVEKDSSAVAPEQLLIKRHKAAGEISWNGTGFGRHDPGRNRDKTIPSAKDFDTRYPIDLTVEVSAAIDGRQTLTTFVNTVKKELPYLFRIEKSPELDDVILEITSSPLSADDAFRLAAAHAPPDWQVCALTGYVIMYKSGQDTYPSAMRYYRGTRVIDASPQSK